MTTWRIPTQRSREAHTEPQVLDRSPCCGARNIPADMMRWIGSLPTEVRDAVGFPPELNYACDGCFATALREGLLSHDEWYEAVSAPPEIVAAAIEHMASFPYREGSRAHEKKLKRHPHLKKPEKTDEE
jgi:hypothetical protein